MWSIHTDAGIKIHDIAFTIGEEVTKNNNYNRNGEHANVVGEGYHYGWQGGHKQVPVV